MSVKFTVTKAEGTPLGESTGTGAGYGTGEADAPIPEIKIDSYQTNDGTYPLDFPPKYINSVICHLQVIDRI